MAGADGVRGPTAQTRVQCPRCGYVMSIFDESSLRANKSVRRAYEHALKNPILCAGCRSWIQRPTIRSGGAR